MKNTQINCDNINFISESLINHSFVSDEERGDDTTENAKINTNEEERFILDILKDVGMEAPTMQKRRKERKIKIKNKSKRSIDKKQIKKVNCKQQGRSSGNN